MGAPRIRTVVVELAKLRDYCLNEGHPRGRHKARVFRSRLGLTSADSEWLRETLASAAVRRLADLRQTESDSYGDRYLLEVDVSVRGHTDHQVRMDCSARRGGGTFDHLLCPLDR